MSDMNRRARFKGLEWESFGSVAHSEAAIGLVKSMSKDSLDLLEQNGGWVVETIDDDRPEAVMHHFVTKEIKWNCNSLRGD